MSTSLSEAVDCDGVTGRAGSGPTCEDLVRLRLDFCGVLLSVGWLSWMTLTTLDDLVRRRELGACCGVPDSLDSSSRVSFVVLRSSSWLFFTAGMTVF